MLLRLLSVTGTLLGSCAARSLPHDHDIDLVPQASNSRVLSHFRQITVPCGECAFTDANCSPDVDATTYLTLSFTTTNTTLNANASPIFPSPVPLQFPAVRHWDSGQQAVTVAYALDARPLPPHPGALLGDIFLLKLRLFDLHGRPATDHIISLGLAKDPAGDLLISKIEADPSRAHGGRKSHHRHKSSSWLAQLSESLKTLKAAAQNCWSSERVQGHSSSSSSYRYGDSQLDAHRTLPADHHHHFTNNNDNSEFNPIYWAGKGSHTSQLLQPIVLPALLGVLAGVVACLTGFIVGRTAIAIYYCCRRERSIRKMRRATTTPTPRRTEEGFVSEKERLMRDELSSN